MKKIKGANLVIIAIACTLGCIIGALTYTSKVKLDQEILQVIKNDEEDGKQFEIWVAEGAVSKALQKELPAFQKQHSDIRMNVKTFKNEIYEENLLNAARTNSLPDMFYTKGDQELKNLVSLDTVMELTDEVDKDKESFRRDTLSSYTVNDRVYGLPLFGWNTVMYCNTELFSKYHMELPHTYDELLDAVQELKKKGVVPIAIGGSNAEMVSSYFMELALNETSVDQVKSAAYYPELLMGRPFTRAAANFRQLIMLRPFQTGYGEADEQEAVECFCRGEAAMMAGSSTLCSSIQKAAEGSFIDQVKVIPFPVNQESSCFKGVAGYSDGFALNAKTKLAPEKTVELYRELMQLLSNQLVEQEGAGFPVYQAQSLENTGFSILKQCEAIFPSGNYHSSYEQLFKDEEAAQYNAALKKLVKGYITDKKFIEEISE